MPDRYCPFCGELVTSNSITCPKCYKKIPADQPARKEDERKGSEKRREYSGKVALALNLIPGLFGILGIGQIYRDNRDAKGYIILVVGLILFTIAMLLILNMFPGPVMNILTKFSAIPVMILYALVYIGAVADIVVGKVLGKFGLRT